MSTYGPPDAVTQALTALGVRRLVVGIHDPALPGVPGDDVGRGSPYSRGAAAFLRFVRALGFDGVQLGPQGQTSAINPSPYDGTIFARNPLSVDLRALTGATGEPALLSETTLARLAAAFPVGWPPDRVPYRHVFAAQQAALDEAFDRFQRSGEPESARQLAAFAQRQAWWIERDGLYEALLREHGGRGFRDWQDAGRAHPDQQLWGPPPETTPTLAERRAELMRTHRPVVDGFVFRQMLAHGQHARLRERCRDLGLELYGDLQIGLSDQDVYSYRPLLLRDYVMGAPPSRTTPTGQAWNYAVLDPSQARGEGSDGALRLLLSRVDKLFDEYDAIRIDHPHGLVCPWVYRANQPDPLHAVQHGARLHGAPDLPDHPELARFAIARPDQLDRSLPRYADDWERDLGPDQIDRYAVFVDAMVASAVRHGRDKRAIVCEVLSTLPRPLAAVLARHGLGRFRVIQKANLDDASDVYRPENARREDWIMAGNHDTPSIWTVERGWAAAGRRERWAEHLGQRLRQDPAHLLAQPGGLVHAVFAEMFASAAENVSIFFMDLFGLHGSYNVPGTINDGNWSLRLGPDFEREYAARLARGEALHLPRALALAFGGRSPDFRRAHAELIAELEQMADRRER